MSDQAQKLREMAAKMDRDGHLHRNQVGQPTPGPWKIDHHSIVDADGKSVADAWTAPFGIEIATANARLIAAAPDLLAALEEMSHELDHGEDADLAYLLSVNKHARAAIAKAKGEA